MRIRHIISGIFTILTVTSCMADMGMEDRVEVGEMPLLHGKVSDEQGTPIEHIKVTLEWNNSEVTDVKYTSGSGMFNSQIRTSENESATTLKITLEDIDGEENGGLFETYTDNITLFETVMPDDSLNGIYLDYRLNRATVSENTPQS